MIKNVSVIGAGTMGNGIAHVFAMKGFSVSLIDISQAAIDKGMATISKNLDRMVAKEQISEADKAQTISNLSTFTSIEEGVKNADIVVEAATENVDLKLKIFQQIDAAAPTNAILATNTSSISITKIAAATNRADKIIGMHFMNPVPVMKLVEVIRGYSTSDDTCATVMEMSKTLVKFPSK